MSAPPGWHRQPDGRDRYWDGTAWTDQYHATDTPPLAVVAQRGGGGIYKPWMGYAGAGLLGLFLGIGMGVAAGSAETDAPTTLPAVTSTVQTTITATTTATPTPSNTPTPTSEASTAATPEVTATPVAFKMPDLVGENLQLAQDKLQKLGSFVLDQQDAAGLDRIQVLDSNWQVCSQRPAPGKTVMTDTVVVLASVKLAEECP